MCRKLKIITFGVFYIVFSSLAQENEANIKPEIQNLQVEASPTTPTPTPTPTPSLNSSLEIKTSSSSLKFSPWVQLGYGYAFLDDAADTSSFDVLRFKLNFEGKTFNDQLRLNVQLAGATNTKPSRAQLLSQESKNGFQIEDVTLGYFQKNYDLRLGQMKVPFGAQWLTPSRELTFIHRPLGTQILNFGRDRGVLLGAHVSKLALRAGVFNGGGVLSFKDPFRNPNVSNGLSNSHLFVTRAQTQLSRPSSHMQLNLGGSFVADFDRSIDLSGSNTEEDLAHLLAFEGDLEFKFKSLTFLGEYIHTRTNPATFTDFSSQTYYGEIHMNWLPILDQGVRVGVLDLNTSTSQDTKIEISSVLALKLKSDPRQKIQLQYTFVRQNTPLKDPQDHFIDLALSLGL